VNGQSLVYDALGRMVEKSSNEQFVYAPGGTQVFAVMSGQTPSLTLFPLTGGAIGMYFGSAGPYYTRADWLGSARFDTTSSETMAADTAYAPFGEQYGVSGNSWYLFAGAGHQWIVGGNTGLDDFPFRKYSPTQGRWISHDPGGMAAVDPTNPQSWNRYAYVMNSPLSLIDPLGLDGDCENDPSNPLCRSVVHAGIPCNGTWIPYQNGEMCVPTVMFGTCLPSFVGTGAGGWGGGNCPSFPTYSGGQQNGAANNGAIEPISRAKCAATFADSIAAHTSGSSPNNPVVQALLGNSISGLYDLWNAPTTWEGIKDLAIGGVNPGLPGPSYGGGASGVATDLTIKAVTIDMGLAAAETAASWFGGLKLAYDGGAFLYAYFHTCH
jgi:RHS repeat-associated protein